MKDYIETIINGLKAWVENGLTRLSNHIAAVKKQNEQDIAGLSKKVEQNTKDISERATIADPVFIGKFIQNPYDGYKGGKYSHAEGQFSRAEGECTHAEGIETLANEDGAHAEGYHTTASGMYSHAEGFRTQASGGYSHAEGEDTRASGGESHAEGHNTRATGGTSHAEGGNTSAEGPHSHAEGVRTRAGGESSHAEGYKTNASGDYSHAEGYDTRAYWNSAHAEGEGTYTVCPAQHVQGRFNFTPNDETIWDDKYAHIVGNGVSDTERSNAHTLDWHGVPWFQGRPQFGGNAQDDDSQQVMANGDTEITLKSADGTAHKVTATDDGKLSVDGIPQGEKGEDGKTLVKGTDYWTASDKQEIVDEVLGEIPSGGFKTTTYYSNPVEPVVYVDSGATDTVVTSSAAEAAVKSGLVFIQAVPGGDVEMVVGYTKDSNGAVWLVTKDNKWQTVNT